MIAAVASDAPFDEWGMHAIHPNVCGQKAIAGLVVTGLYLGQWRSNNQIFRQRWIGSGGDVAARVAETKLVIIGKFMTRLNT